MTDYPTTLICNAERFEIRDLGDKGVGLFAVRDFKTGEEIYPFDYWSEEIRPIHATNHSCNPSASFNDEGMLLALRDHLIGEEITFNYLLHPIPASPWNFACQCGSANCVGWIDARLEQEMSSGE